MPTRIRTQDDVSSSSSGVLADGVAVGEGSLVGDRAASVGVGVGETSTVGVGVGDAGGGVATTVGAGSTSTSALIASGWNRHKYR
jgi:hypothetical protein